MSEEDITQYFLILHRDEEDAKTKSALKTESSVKGNGRHTANETHRETIRLGITTIVAQVTSKAPNLDTHQKSQTSVVPAWCHKISVTATYTMRNTQNTMDVLQTGAKGTAIPELNVVLA